MSGRRPALRNTPHPPPHDPSQTIHDLTALVWEQNAQIRQLINLQNRPLPPPQQAPPQAIYERFLKLHPSEFHGGPDPTKAEEWIKSLEVIFEYLKMNDRDHSLRHFPIQERSQAMVGRSQKRIRA